MRRESGIHTKKKIPKVCIIILNWNSWSDTIECLESIFKIKYESYDVIVVDNASEDDSVKKIINFLESEVKFKFYEHNSKNKSIKCIYKDKNEKYNLNNGFPRTIIIENDDNYGFAKGNNIGIKYVETSMNPDYILLLNNDTVVDKEFLKELIYIAESKSDIGFVGPKVYYYEFNGRKDVINFAGGFLNIWKGQTFHEGINEFDKGQLDTINEVNYVQGSCLLFKKEIIENVGLMNPDYFMYWEEADWCYRGFKEGYKSMYAPKAKIWHKTLSSSGGSYSFNVAYHMSRNRFMFMKNNASKPQLFSFFLYFIIFDFWINLIFLLKEKNKNGFIGFIKGLKDGTIYFFKSTK